MQHCFLSTIILSLLIVIGARQGLADESVLISSGKGVQEPRQPQVAVGANGTVHLVYGVGEGVAYCQSKDGAQTFSSPVTAFRVTNMSLGMRRGPRVAVTSKAIVVTAVGGMMGKGRDGDVIAWRSMDGGSIWSGPVLVNDVADAAREGLHAMAAGEDGSVWCVWLDLRDKLTEIYASRSVDGGASWERNISVYKSPEKSVCECCHPSVIVSGKTVHIMFRNSLDGERDMYVTSSKDDGATFSKAIKPGKGTWQLDACPMDGGMLAAGKKGGVLTLWQRNGEIYMAEASGAAEKLLGAGQQPWMTGTAKGPFMVWTVKREGDLMLQSPGLPTPRRIAVGARDPVIASSGSDGTVVCCWESKQNGQSTIMAMALQQASASPSGQ